MGRRRTGSYDALVALTGPGLSRLIGAALLEGYEEEGLPFPVVIEQGEGGEATGLSLFLGLPTVRAEGRNLVVIFPFQDGSILTGASCLAGHLELAVPIVDEDGALAPRLDRMEVVFTLAGNDPDPHADGKTSVEKVDPFGVAILNGLMEGRLRSDPPEEIAAMFGSGLLASLVGTPACPVAAFELDSADRPVLVPPVEPRSIDVELHHGGFGAADDLVLVKAKISERAEALGTEGDLDPDLDWLDGDLDMEVLLSNRLLMEEIVPAAVITALLVEQEDDHREAIVAEVTADDAFTAAVEADLRASIAADASLREEVLQEVTAEVEDDPDVSEADREAEIELRFLIAWPLAVEDRFDDRLSDVLARRRRERVDRLHEERWPEEVTKYFAFPLEQNVPIPRRLPLPTLGQILGYPPDEDQDTEVEPPTEPNVTLTSVVHTLVDEPDGHGAVRVEIDLIGATGEYSFSGSFAFGIVLAHEDGRLVVATEVEGAKIDVHLAPLWAVGAVAGFLTPFIGGLLIGLVVAVVVDLVVDSLASQGVSDVAAGQLGEAGVDIGSIVDGIVVRRAVLDDLALGGDFRIGHETSSGSQAVVTEESSVRDEGSVAVSPGDATLLTIERDGGDLTITGMQVTPLGDVRLADMGRMGETQAQALGQIDLWPDTLDFAAAPLALEAAPGSVHVIGVAHESGRRSLVQVRSGLFGVEEVRWRLYHRSTQEVLLVARGNHGGAGSLTTSDCATTLVHSEDIDIPVLVGSESSVLDTVAVGFNESICVYDATLTLIGRRMRAPIGDVAWRVVRADGTAVSIEPGDGVVVDVSVEGEDSAPVTFTIDDAVQPSPATFAWPWRLLGACTARSEQGTSGRFVIEATITEKYDNVHVGSTTVEFQGRRHSFFGLDRWLDRFERALAHLAGSRPGVGTIDPVDRPAHGPGVRCVTIVDSAGSPHRADPRGRRPLGGTGQHVCVDMNRPGALHRWGGELDSADPLRGLEAKQAVRQRLDQAVENVARSGAVAPKTLDLIRRQVDAAWRALPDPRRLLRRSGRSFDPS